MIIKPSKDTKIYWGPISTTSYYYGSAIKACPDKSVVFKNGMIPSSQIIKEWHSFSTFQSTRVLPMLRLLKRKKRYKLTTNMTVIPEDTVFVEIVFKNRFGETISNKISKEQELIFTYPREAYTYSIRLISAGLEEIHFSFIEISDIEDKLEN